MIFEPAPPQRIFLDRLQKQSKTMGFISVGIGKTAAVLQHISDLLLNADIIGALVVAPVRVINLTWPSEIQSWSQFRWMRYANLRTESGQRAFLQGTAHVFGINYESLHTLVSLIQRRKGKLPYSIEIWDECTKSKNPSSKRINHFRRHAPRTERRVALTGTPAPNSHLDLFAQVRLIDDGERLGPNFLTFKKTHYFCPAMPWQPWKPKAGTDKAIEDKISDLTVTLRASDWLNLPDQIIEDVEIDLPKDLREKYETLEKELVLELKHDQTMNVGSAAALITKLLQFTSGHVYDEAREVHPIHNLKFDALARLAKTEKQPLLVATIFLHEQDRIRKQFPEAKFFADAKNEVTQKQLLDDWNAGKIKMLVAHPASCSHGLNMQYGSSVMVWMSLTYSRELYEQMIGRIARRGQKNLIKIYRLMCVGTVDDAVAEALANKSANEARLISALQMLESYRNQKP